MTADTRTRRRRWLQAMAMGSALISGAKALDQSTLNLVEARLAESANYSWEIGTRAQALLEYHYAPMSVFGNISLPLAAGVDPPIAVTDIATNVVRNKPANTTALFSDGSAADPCSMGVAVLLANATLGSSTVPFAAAASSQLENILTTNRTSDGAISHRVNVVELWSDFVYMAPPFIAYYGAMTSNMSLLQQAYDQCRLYRLHLDQPSGLWQHIVLGNTDAFGSPDNGSWSTGNGWAAAGMMRVAATIERSQYAANMSQQVSDLYTWTSDIVNAAWPYSQTNASGMLRNYIDEATFVDASGTTLLAAVVYRLAAINQGSSQLSRAEAFYQNLPIMINSTGWLNPVVNPLNYPVQGFNGSPEGQAFVLMLESARRDYNARNTTVSPDAPPAGSSGASPALAISSSLAVIIAILACVRMS